MTALIVQNAVAHLQGLSDPWDIRKTFWQNRAAHEEKMRRALLSIDVARQRHLAGARNPKRIDPDTWVDEFAFLTRPGMDRIQLDLMFDYRANVAAYPRWQAYLREHYPPTLVVWEKFDPLFTVARALAFKREIAHAEFYLVDAGHFALGEEVDRVAEIMRRFLHSRLRSHPIENPQRIEMAALQTPINGNEAQENLSSPFQALVQFYRAFNQRDLDLMAENWAQLDDVVMDNPLGGIKRGWPEIRAVYEKIFNGAATVKVEFYDYTIHECGDVFYAVGRERGRLTTDESELTLAIRTTRVFKRINDRWRQTHHHGSFDDPKLLQSYQAAVLGTSSRLRRQHDAGNDGTPRRKQP